MFYDDDFGAQGGDPRRMAGLQIDLSTCVNFYGPPPAVTELLRDGVDPRDLQIHPYGAAERMEAAYARHLGVPASQLVAGRGTTEFIWALSRELPHAAVAVPLPGYTDYLKAFPGRGFAGEQVPTVEHTEAALASASLVILSNPHNPSGVTLDPAELIEVARRHPDAILVVDESYVDFVPDPAGASVVGADVANIVVLRSPSKFWGIAATRVGVAWCADRQRLCSLLGRRETWPISGLDVAVAEAAMTSVDGPSAVAWTSPATQPGWPTPCASCPARSSSTTSRCTIAASSPSTPTSSPRGWRATVSACACSVAHTASIPARCACSRRCRINASLRRARWPRRATAT